MLSIRNFSGQLSVIKTTDEDLNVSYTFTDEMGHVVLTRQMKGSETHDTYYVYDDKSNLCFVLQPMYQSSANLDLYAFQYKYDGRNRCIWKKLPGAGYMEMVYDNADRLVFSQDGNQRALTSGNWTYYKYDGLNRLTEQGTCTNKVTTSGTNVLVQHFYDSYAFRSQAGFNNSNFPDDASGNGKGALTASVATVLGSSNKIYTAYYYDIKGRVAKTVQSNLLGGYDVTATIYTFTDKPATVTHTHTASGKPTRTEMYTYSYNHADRLLKVEHTLGGTKITLADYAYDNLGRLQSKSLHGSATNKLTYAYNVRGWLTGISGSKFTQNLYYNTGTGTAKYNGSISSMTWKAGNESTIRGYKFTYDGLSRLMNATYGETAGINTNTNRFSENVTAYDKNGNIKTLQRYGQTAASGYGLIDNLTFTLGGNLLNRVDDAAAASAYGGGFEFKDGVKQANEYTYDSNGNLTKDLNKGISTITYNVLNLPNMVTFSDGSTIAYTYGADGTKLKTVHKTGSTTTTTDYCGNVVYENGVQKLLLTDEGYVTLSDGKYHYYLKDHQGNNRVVINQSGTVEETNHYYPFGGVFASSGNVQPYKYNGKELDAKKGLNWYDYGARHYDAALGRFTTNDRFAEKYHSMSPYQYGANNPVKNVDVNGDSIVVLNYTSGEHLGLLIQNSSNRWEYYSFNGDKIYNSTEGSLGGGPQDNKGELSWPTPQAFLDSEYNQNTYKEDLESGKVNGYGYQEGYLIPTTEKQDRIIKNTFLETVDQGYSLVGNHCSIVVQKSLNKAGIETMNKMKVTNRQTGNIFNVKVNPYLLSKAYQAIEKNNPLGYIIRRNK
ncbi:RHS repeat domain-containing protein [Bacteroides uniformis]|uniref:RHS repeat-associated core domain protein n=1 Tax=Bacteroides uniformis (strain ATCC 8492 / DSM 6597 / CCUG 4942 / CIP 103695 / JCM 5828 / KCTC 5204 / NCTC 13054 / VPI 0061) TaxID=411479 RepID=A0ABC9NGH9_BACUC|nr:RHS repeat-associated core domain protein [Bacteroides uniformis ATCC 8492]QUT61611.1 Rhs_assc_core: RHS repeat-associated core domain protein [Bacteroides uniformis]